MKHHPTLEWVIRKGKNKRRVQRQNAISGHKLIELKLSQPLWEIVWKSPKKLKIELPHDSGIPPPSVYPNKFKTVWLRGLCTLCLLFHFQQHLRCGTTWAFITKWVSNTEVYSSLMRRVPIGSQVWRLGP